MCDSLVRIYQSEGVEVQALQGLDLLVEDGELVAIVGASGSGKSTLLSVLSGLDVPTAGKVRVGPWDLMAMSSAQRVEYRRSMVGFVWQQTARNVVPYLTATENVAFPLALAGVRRKERDRRAAELLEVLGVGYCADRRPGQMSGGEQQRVAIAVALANSPQVLFADEPTGELDSATSHDVLEGLRTVNRELGTTVVVVTHDPGRERARAADRRHPRRAHQLGDRAAHAHPRRRHRARGRRGARGARPGGPRAAAARVPGGPEPRRAACGWRWRSRTSRCGRTGRCRRATPADLPAGTPRRPRGRSPSYRRRQPPDADQEADR